MRVAVLVSGSGTNLQALLDAESRGELAPATVALVLCNRPGARALDRARAVGKPVAVVDHTEFPAREAFEDAMLAHTATHGAEAVVLAGFMRILTPRFVDAWSGNIINTHPSLLPAFPGVRAVEQALAHGVKITGCTIHFVDTGLDSGPIILQAAVPVLEDDDAARLHARILEREHELLPRAVKLLASGKLRRHGRRVSVG